MDTIRRKRVTTWFGNTFTATSTDRSTGSPLELLRPSSPAVLLRALAVVALKSGDVEERNMQQKRGAGRAGESVTHVDDVIERCDVMEKMPLPYHKEKLFQP